MPDTATAAALHLKRVVETWVSAHDDGTELEQAIDDGGVREAMRLLEHLKVDWDTIAFKRVTVDNIIAALIGTQAEEMSDGV